MLLGTGLGRLEHLDTAGPDKQDSVVRLDLLGQEQGETWTDPRWTGRRRRLLRAEPGRAVTETCTYYNTTFKRGPSESPQFRWDTAALHVYPL